jgi:hypothetical protein
VVQGEEYKGLDELGFHGGSPDCKKGLTGEDRGPLGDRPDVPGEAEGTEVVQKFLPEASFGAEKLNVLLVKAEILDVIHDLLQPGGDGKAAFVGHRAEKHVKVADLLGYVGLEVSVGHGKLVKIAEHGVVEMVFHGGPPF